MNERTVDGYAYPSMEPPFPAKAMAKSSRAEARRQFEWLIAQSPQRRNTLIAAAVAGGVTRVELDYSPGSLVPLWSWAIPNLREEGLTPEEQERRLVASPRWARRAGIQFGELSFLTKCLCVDIGFYFAEVLMRRHPHLHWALWTKKAGPYHLEFIQGFPDAYLVPQHLVAACAWMVVKGEKQRERLLREYEHWERMLTG